MKDPTGADFWKSEESLDDARYFQIMKGGGYTVTGGISFSTDDETGIPTTACASLLDTSPAKPICDKHMALMIELDDFFDNTYGITDYTYDDPEIGVGEFAGRLYGSSDTVSGGSRSFAASGDYVGLMAIYQTYEVELEAIETALGETGNGVPTGYLEFFKFTDEGARLANRMIVMRPALELVSERYAEDWFGGGQEATVLKDRVTNEVIDDCVPVSGWADTIHFQTVPTTEIAVTENCIAGKISLILADYNTLELDAQLGLPFITYTTHNCEGQQMFLNTLSVLADISRPVVVAPATDYQEFIATGDECNEASLADRVKECYLSDFISGFENSLANSPIIAKVEERSELEKEVTNCP